MTDDVPPPVTARDLLLELSEDGSTYERTVALTLARLDAKINAVMAFLINDAQGKINAAGVTRNAREELLNAKKKIGL